MAKEFLTVSRRDPGYRPKEERVKDYKPVERDFTKEEASEQALRCIDCGIPFCHGAGCPLGNAIPEFNSFVRANNWKAALDVLLDTSPFPEFMSRICPALCEGSCVNGLNSNPVSVRHIERAIIETGFASGWVKPFIPQERNGKSVAVIGAGPSGLATAESLNRLGFKVTVYNAAKYPGGLMRYGIPDFKLDKQFVERRIKLMEEEGIEFVNNVEVGVDVSADYILRNVDAMVLTCGCRKPRDLAVPGRENQGIYFALDFLTQQNRLNGGESFTPDPDMNAKGKRVVVVGGGDTGSDCIGTSIRQGAESVVQIEIMPRPSDTRAPNNPWPEWPRVFKETSSHKEGCERRWNINTLEAVGENGHVKQLRCTEVDWQKDANGRMIPVAKEGGEFVLEADLVLLAMGFVGHAAPKIVENLGLATDERGRIVADALGRTSRENVFIAGDMLSGPSLVVRAAASGMQTAKNVGKALLGK